MIQYLTARVKITKTCGCNIPGICPSLGKREGHGWCSEPEAGGAGALTDICVFLFQIRGMLTARFSLEMLNILVSTCEDQRSGGAGQEQARTQEEGCFLVLFFIYFFFLP